MLKVDDAGWGKCKWIGRWFACNKVIIPGAGYHRGIVGAKFKLGVKDLNARLQRKCVKFFAQPKVRTNSATYNKFFGA